MKKWIWCYILHTHNHWGWKFNKPFNPTRFRYIIQGNTYYRPFWGGLKTWWKWNIEKK